ncbi:MAG: hypothetical protein WCJ87_08370 [Burkholderiales bacterium]
MPDDATLSAIKSAALQGVHVRLLVQKQCDSKLVTAAVQAADGEAPNRRGFDVRVGEAGVAVSVAELERLRTLGRFRLDPDQ